MRAYTPDCATSNSGLIWRSMSIACIGSAACTLPKSEGATLPVSEPTDSYMTWHGLTMKEESRQEIQEASPYTNYSLKNASSFPGNFAESAIYQLWKRLRIVHVLPEKISFHHEDILSADGLDNSSLHHRKRLLSHVLRHVSTSNS